MALLGAVEAWGKVTMQAANRLFASSLGILCSLTLLAGTALGREISSYAAVNPDGSLRVDGKTVHLVGIHIPDTDRSCRTNRNPPVCGTRAALALEFKIDGFVLCDILSRNDDGSVVGWCRVNASRLNEGEDLSAYLLERGWAVALPDAPFEYQTLEKIARSRSLGVWGIPVDNIVNRP
jgi:endonuclease YncB( thermonuclease family)